MLRDNTIIEGIPPSCVHSCAHCSYHIKTGMRVLDMMERAEEVLSASPQQLLQHLTPVLLGASDASTPSLGTGAKRVRALRSLAKAAEECGNLHVHVHSTLELCVALMQAQAPVGGSGKGAAQVLAVELTTLARLLHEQGGSLQLAGPCRGLVARLQGLLLTAMQRIARALPTDATPPVGD